MNTINTGEQLVLRMHDGGAVWGTLDRINETHIVLNEVETDDPYTLAKYADEVGFPFSDITRVFYKDNVFWEAKKTCSICNEERELSQFSNHIRMKSGKRNNCRICVAKVNASANARGRILLKPIQDKNGLSRTDAAIWYATKNVESQKSFMSHVQEVESGCFEWTGALSTKGYGLFSVYSTDGAKLSVVRAHRLSWAATHGFDALPKSLVSGLASDTFVINHTCHNRKCVNPAHLETITNRENVSSAKRKPKESDNV